MPLLLQGVAGSLGWLAREELPHDATRPAADHPVTLSARRRRRRLLEILLALALALAAAAAAAAAERVVAIQLEVRLGEQHELLLRLAPAQLHEAHRLAALGALEQVTHGAAVSVFAVMHGGELREETVELDARAWEV